MTTPHLIMIKLTINDTQKKDEMLPKPIKDQINKKKQSIYILLPFFLLVIFLGALNLFPRNSIKQEPMLFTSTPTMIQEQLVQVQPTELIETTSTPTSSPLPTATLTPSQTPEIIPQFPPGIDITLLGPPTDSVFPLNSQISLYWTWSIPLGENQTFAIFLYLNDQEYLVGTTKKPDVGTTYHFVASFKDLIQEPKIVQWQIKLTSPQSTTALIESDIRSLNLIPDFTTNDNGS